MPLQIAVRVAQRRQVAHREESAVGQRAVKSRRGMPLGEHKAVAALHLRLFGVDAQLPVIQISEHLRRGKASARMTRLRAVRRFDNSHADLAGRNRELLLFLIGHNTLPDSCSACF